MLQVFVLGGFRLLVDHRAVARFAPPRVEALLSFLMLQPHRLWPRDTLAELFWGQARAADARNSLNTCLCQLRHALAALAGGDKVLVVQRTAVGANPDASPWLDVHEFERAVRDAAQPSLSSAECLAFLRRADELYGGALLDGQDYEWCLVERERLASRHQLVLERLMKEESSRGDLDGAVAIGRRILSVDPLREDIHRELMRLQGRLGRRTDALRQFTVLRQLLKRELNIEPMPETVAAWREISHVNEIQTHSAGARLQTEVIVDVIEDLQRQLVALHRDLILYQAETPDRAAH